MTSFTHVLVTRFNLLRPGVELADAWYEQRFALFERFCLPSVQSQTNQSFYWLLFADARTPDAYRARIEAYQSCANLRVHWLAGPDRVQMVQAVRLLVDETTTHLISTTLDNDDALGREFVEQLQAQFAAQEFELINFLHGLRYDLRAKKLYACDLESNPFISLVEKIDVNRQFRSIIGCLPHSQIKERFSQIRNVIASPLWLQVIHGNNAEATGVWGRPRVSIEQLAAFFDLDYVSPQAGENELTFRLQHARAHMERRLINVLSDEQQLRVRRLLGKFFG